MEKIEWDQKKYSVGYLLMDDQHQEILEAINGLIDLSETEYSVQEARGAFVELSQLVVKHFGAEEAILRLEKADFYERHMDVHDQFSKRLADKISNCNGLHLSEGIRFVADWWVDHILHEDMEYKPLFTDI